MVIDHAFIAELFDFFRQQQNKEKCSLQMQAVNRSHLTRVFFATDNVNAAALGEKASEVGRSAQQTADD